MCSRYGHDERFRVDIIIPHPHSLSAPIMAFQDHGYHQTTAPTKNFSPGHMARQIAHFMDQTEAEMHLTAPTHTSNVVMSTMQPQPIFQTPQWESVN